MRHKHFNNFTHPKTAQEALDKWHYEQRCLYNAIKNKAPYWRRLMIANRICLAWFDVLRSQGVKFYGEV